MTGIVSGFLDLPIPYRQQILAFFSPPSEEPKENLDQNQPIVVPSAALSVSYGRRSHLRHTISSTAKLRSVSHDCVIGHRKHEGVQIRRDSSRYGLISSVS